MNFSWHPHVGVFIAVLAFLGVLFPLIIEKVGKTEKVLWTLALFALVGLEIRSIHLERGEHDREQAQVRAEELRRFVKIAAGIDNAIRNSQNQFDATMARTGKMINLERSTLDGVKRSLDEITGGNGFPLVYPIPLLNSTGGMRLMIFARNNILSDVSCVIREENPRRYSRKIPVGLVRANSEDSAEVLDYEIHPSPTIVNRYGIVVSARNGDTVEELELRFNSASGLWEWHITVTRGWPGNRKVIFEQPWPSE